MSVITIPLNTGCHEETDQRLMTDGRLRTVRNGRLDREGRIRVRAGYTAIDTGVYSSGAPADMVAYDLATFRGRLVALGDKLDCGFATDLFEYVGEAQAWRSQATSESFTIPLPRATNLRNVAGVGMFYSSRIECSVAAGGGLVCHSHGGNRTNSVSRLLISKADTDQTLIHERLLIGLSAHPVALSDRFIVPGVLIFSNRLLSAYIIAFNAEGIAASPTTILDAGLGNTVQVFNTCPVTGADQFCVVARLSTGAVAIRRYTASGVVVVPSGGQYADITAAPSSVAIEADVTNNTVNVGLVTAGVVQLYTYNLATGAAIGVGPHSSAGLGATPATRIELVRAGTQVVCCADVTSTVSSTTVPTAVFEVYTPLTNAFDLNSTTSIQNSSLCCRPVIHSGELVYASSYGGFTGGVGVANIGPLVLFSIVFNDGTSGVANNRVVPLAQVDLDISQGAFGQLALDSSTDKYYWARTGDNGPIVTEFELGSTERRQMVQCGNILYIAGGLPLAYDGRTLAEMNFVGRPVLLSLTAGGSGSLDDNSTYTYESHWRAGDADDNTINSAVSVPEEETTGTSDNITVVRTTPHTLRVNANSVAQGGDIQDLLFRNTVDLVDTVPTPAVNLQQTAVSVRSASQATGGAAATADANSDTAIETQPIIYTQVQTNLDNHAPLPCKYMAYGSDRMFVAGLPFSDQWQCSKPLQPSEQIAFAQDGVLAFSGRIRGEIRAVICAAQSTLFIAKRELWLLNGSGPSLTGQGEFQAAYRIPSDGGMREDGWRSVVEFGKGYMYQLEDEQLYLWSGGQPAPVGLEIQDTLEEFPNVVAACHITGQQCVALALQNDAGNDGCIVLWDQQTNQWFRDDVGAVDSLAEHEGRLAYLQGGVVYLEDADYGLGTAPTLTLETGNVAKTGSAGASGVQRIMLTGVYQDDFTAELLIKYTDAQTFTSLGSIAFMAANGYSAGDPLDQEWIPADDDVSRFELQLVISGGTATKMGWLNALEITDDVDDGPKRVPDARRR